MKTFAYLTAEVQEGNNASSFVIEHTSITLTLKTLGQPQNIGNTEQII
jgi:hypothetical protein